MSNEIIIIIDLDSRPQLEAKIAVTSGWSGIFNVQSNCCISLPLIQSSFHHYTAVAAHHFGQIFQIVSKIYHQVLSFISIWYRIQKSFICWSFENLTTQSYFDLQTYLNQNSGHSVCLASYWVEYWGFNCQQTLVR